MSFLVETESRADVAAGAGPYPMVIGHRGACGYLPENTLASFRLAIRLGADSVEPDVVSTRDGVLVVRHENELNATTDVAEHSGYAGRRTARMVDGVLRTGWFVEDFTLAELKRLRARERHPRIRPGSAAHDGRFDVPTLQEVIDLVQVESIAQRRRIGMHVEVKHATYLAGRGLSPVEPLIRTLRANGLDGAAAPVCVQSFETTVLRRLSATTQVPLIQLVDSDGAPYDLHVVGDPRTYDHLVTPAGLDRIADYAIGVSVHTDRIVPVDRHGRTGVPTGLVASAQDRALAVLTWTLREENRFLPARFRSGADPAARGDMAGWAGLLLAQGVDGVFSDHPDTALQAVHSRAVAAA